MSKGSKRRPQFVTTDTFNENWDRIFKKDTATVPDDCDYFIDASGYVIGMDPQHGHSVRIRQATQEEKEQHAKKTNL